MTRRQSTVVLGVTRVGERCNELLHEAYVVVARIEHNLLVVVRFRIEIRIRVEG